LSPAVVADLLRKKMGYDGVVMTDDLDMGAIKPTFDIDTVIDQILRADVDIALICHKGPDIQAACERMRQTIADKADLRKMGKLSVERILRLKRTYLNGNWVERFGITGGR
jgi:beta-N-acetylhexosaminidase